jgi:hypothetical protein
MSVKSIQEDIELRAKCPDIDVMFPLSAPDEVARYSELCKQTGHSDLYEADWTHEYVSLRITLMEMGI